VVADDFVKVEIGSIPAVELGVERRGRFAPGLARGVFLECARTRAADRELRFGRGQVLA
jgi:hypothetical protein